MKIIKKNFLRIVILICGFFLDMGLIVYIELAQLISLCFIRKQQILIIIVEQLILVLVLRHIANKGMPSKKLGSLVKCNIEEERLDKLTTEFKEHICDEICQYPHILTEEELVNRCLCCQMETFISRL